MKKMYLSCLLLTAQFINAQTDIDGIMMSKSNLCIGAVYQYSSWDNYWEGDFKRTNLNLGTVSTKSTSVMGNYGISDKLNVLFNLPYVKTNASAGTMKGQEGMQDLALSLKYMPIEKTVDKNTYSLYVIGSYTTPLSDYAADYLPLSIGLKSKTATLRLMGDYQRAHFFATYSAAYVKRSTISIDRNAYLTNTEIVYSNEVTMPDLISVNLRTGYRSSRLIAEFIIDNWVTQKGGFNISKNNMPFPSNTMNMIRYGIYSKYTLKKIPELSLLGGYNYVAEGKNVGQSKAIYGGVFYIINFENKANETEK
ncbi:MAG: hypothetical protein ACRC6O_07825 [Flavobacterium sp.]